MAVYVNAVPFFTEPQMVENLFEELKRLHVDTSLLEIQSIHQNIYGWDVFFESNHPCYDVTCVLDPIGANYRGQVYAHAMGLIIADEFVIRNYYEEYLIDEDESYSTMSHEEKWETIDYMSSLYIKRQGLFAYINRYKEGNYA